jgi:DNA-binding beta-propeller fold protein YncE
MIFDAAGNLYVANSGNNTIEKFAPDGTDLGVFVNTGLGPHFLALGTFMPGGTARAGIGGALHGAH